MNAYKKKTTKYMEVFNEYLLTCFCYTIVLIQMASAKQSQIMREASEVLAICLVATVIVLLTCNIIYLFYKMMRRVKKILKKRMAKKVKLNTVLIGERPISSP